MKAHSSLHAHHRGLRFGSTPLAKAWTEAFCLRHRLSFVAQTDRRGEGILVSKGGTPSGFVLYFEEGKIIYAYNYLQKKTYSITSAGPLAPGKHTITCQFAADQDRKERTGGKGSLLVDGESMETVHLEKTIPLSFSSDETFDIGEEFGSPVVPSYGKRMPFRGNGEIKSVKVQLMNK